MSRRRRRRTGRVVGLGFCVAIFVGSAIFALRQGLVSPRAIAALIPLDLAVPDAYFLDWRLAALKSDRELCRRIVAAPHVVSAEVDDWQNAEGCGWTNGLRLQSTAGARIPVDKISCELTAAIALWLAHEVQPRAKAAFGEGVASIDHLGGFACRNIRGSAAYAKWRSQHASANAIDITAFVLERGRRIAVLKTWGGDGTDARFLSDIHSAACRYFRVAIGPAYNAAHRDHFHYDRGPLSACR